MSDFVGFDKFPVNCFKAYFFWESVSDDGEVTIDEEKI